MRLKALNGGQPEMYLILFVSHCAPNQQSLQLYYFSIDAQSQYMPANMADTLQEIREELRDNNGWRGYWSVLALLTKNFLLYLIHKRKWTRPGVKFPHNTIIFLSKNIHLRPIPYSTVTYKYWSSGTHLRQYWKISSPFIIKFLDVNLVVVSPEHFSEAFLKS